MTGSDASVLDLPRLGDVDLLIGYHLRRASAVVGADFSRTLGDMGMRQVLFAILSVVAANPGVNQGAVGRALGVQRANMVSLINELVDRGWLARAAAADDRRAFALALTPAGDGARSEARARIAAHEDRLLADLDPADRQKLIDLLGRIEAKES